MSMKHEPSHLVAHLEKKAFILYFLTATPPRIPQIASYESVSLAFLPRTDGVFLTDLAQNLIAAGSYAKNVSIISGDQYDEGVSSASLRHVFKLLDADD